MPTLNPVPSINPTDAPNPTLTPEPTASGPATPAPTPSPLVFDQLTEVWRDATERCTMFEVELLPELRLITRGVCNSRAVLWESASGLDWTRLIDRPADTGFMGMVVGPDGRLLLAVNGPQGPAIWSGDPRGDMAVTTLSSAGNTMVNDIAWNGESFLAVGSHVQEDFSSRGVAWLGQADGIMWREIEVPAEVEFFEVVVGHADTRSFTASGGDGRRGPITWERDAAGVWSPAREGISEFIDPDTALSGDGVWRRRDGSWTKRLIRTNPDMSAASGERLPDGWIVAGWPPGKIGRPFMVFVARDDGGWRELPRISGEDPAILDFIHYAGALIGVGDAVWVGPAHARDY